MIAAILRAHGYRVGGYYSPFVYDIRERVQIDGKMISQADFAQIINELIPHLNVLEAEGYGSTTEFELKTALGFLHFERQIVDIAAVEVGIGGRLDATNVLAPCATVITNIGLDHVAILGDTLELIAGEKAGIIKPGVPCVTAVNDAGPLEVIRLAAVAREAPLRLVVLASDSVDKNAQIICDYRNDDSTIVTDRADYSKLQPAMKGRHQLLNAACAIGAVEDIANSVGFRVDVNMVRQGLSEAQMPGRYEVVSQNPKIVFDGAHNSISAKALAAQIKQEKFNRLHLIVGTLLGHDTEDILHPLAGLATVVYATQPSWDRSRPSHEVANCAMQYCDTVYRFDRPADAYAAAVATARPDDLILITGSFYLLGEAIGR